MKFEMIGHEYRYAVDQTVAALKLEGELRSKLSYGSRYVTASADYNGYKGTARCRAEDISDSTAQKIIKTSIYRAVIASGAQRPPWGALTGVRPGKLMRPLMNAAEFSKLYDVSRERAQLCYETACFTQAAQDSLLPGDVCLYVGIPFCPTRCAYCSFVSASVEKSMKLIEPFIDALLKEMDKTEIGGNIVSVYFGGGTPTTLNPEQLDRVLGRLEQRYDLTKLREFTVEAGRPDTITAQKLEVLKRHGVTRVSVNPQTMSDSVLEAIGRKHTAEDIRQALKLVRQAGGIEINMDLIAGLPSDSVEGFFASIDEVINLSPENITVHTLSLKNGSNITVKGTDIPGAAEVARMLDYAYGRLRENGYKPYYLYRQKNMSGGFENTGWTKQGNENLYNICMMEELCSVIALGAGGSTKIIEDGKISRKVNPKYPLEYIERYVQA